MNVTCHSCSTVYRVDPLKVPATGVRARCKVCAAVFPVHRPESVPAPTPKVAAPGAPPPEITAPRPAQPAPIPQVTTEAPIRPPAPPPALAPPVAPRVTMAPPPALPGLGGRPTQPRQFAPAAPPPSAPPATHAPVAPRPSMPVSAAAAVPPAAAPKPAPPLREPSKTGSRPVNPFLTADPSQKARRLARALISDLAVYYPDRRKEGLANGTLKELFKEEIQKSWEEYSDQVGKEVANSTSFFTDALNEILAGGQRVF